MAHIFFHKSFILTLDLFYRLPDRSDMIYDVSVCQRDRFLSVRTPRMSLLVRTSQRHRAIVITEEKYRGIFMARSAKGKIFGSCHIKTSGVGWRRITRAGDCHFLETDMRYSTRGVCECRGKDPSEYVFYRLCYPLGLM